MLKARRLAISVVLAGFVILVGSGSASADTYWGYASPAASAAEAFNG